MLHLPDVDRGSYHLVVDLNKTPPTLNEVTFNLPILDPSGGELYNGEILYSTSWENGSGLGEQRPSLQLVDPELKEATVLLNNYFGFFFNRIDDLTVHPQPGQILFTDPTYTWYSELSNRPPSLHSASYRFDPATGAVFMIDDTMTMPNEIAFSPDGQTLYISDTSAVSPCEIHEMAARATSMIPLPDVRYTPSTLATMGIQSAVDVLSTWHRTMQRMGSR
ncbi:hypothetical protein RBB50_008383 [Rhinocladiella similis]